MNEIRCIFCETESKQVVIEENGYKGKKCPQCGLIYTSPRPSFEEVVDLYGHDGAHISAESHISAEFSRRLYARHHLRIVRSFINGGELLEIGAGAGYFLDEARKSGFSPHGLEFNPVQARHIRNNLNIPCEESALSASIFEGKKFDVIYHCDVISHFFDPIADFNKMNEIMKDESFLVFETGNLGDVDQKYFRYFHRFQYPDHLFFFSTDNLVGLLEKTGFDLIKIYRYSILPQLKMGKGLSSTKSALKKHFSESKKNEKHPPESGTVDSGSVEGSQSLNTESLVKKIIGNTYKCFNYVLRYRVGRIASKAGRPQTVMVVARKRI